MRIKARCSSYRTSNTFVCFLGNILFFSHRRKRFNELAEKLHIRGIRELTRMAKTIIQARTLIQLSELHGLQFLNWVPHDRMNLLSRHMVELRVSKGEVLYRPGQQAKHLYCVLEGAVGLSLSGSKGRFLRLALLTRGEFFGVSALVPGWRRVSRAIALRDSLAWIPMLAV